ncbi:hybrid sensor histidine kinase/response regulator [Beijerinckia mobilis]|uniref:hybrid sensor histidine kinase/response regulator n=1 Tax=Beijerinckia mobilis TaxID=231434 RepID=UPI000689CE47|nr:hybrid sensor histidine kinase/response regulator [Beijerinckia mobilis]
MSSPFPSPLASLLPRHLTRKPIPLVLLLGALAGLVLTTAASVSLIELRKRDFNEARDHLSMLNQLVLENVERAVGAIDLILQNSQETMRSRNKLDAGHFDTLGQDETTQHLLATAVKNSLPLESLDLIDADGHRLVSSNDAGLPNDPANTDLTEQMLHAMRENQDGRDLFISEPLRNPLTDTRTMLLGRRLYSDSGVLLGALIGQMDPAYFRNLFRIIRKNPDIAISLWRRDGTLLTPQRQTFPFPKVWITKLFQDFDSAGSDSHAAMVEQFEHGPSRLVVLNASSTYPLAVMVSFASSQIYLTWWRTVIMAVIGCLLCFLLISFAIWLLTRQMLTYDALDVAIAEKSQAIAARNEAEAQLRQAQKLEAIGQLTGGIAHDFNNLLTAVLGNLELLNRHVEGGDAKMQRWTRNALEAAKRGASLTARLLAFSRRQPLEPKAADLHAMLLSMNDLLSRTLGENIQIEMQIAPDLWQPFVDINQLDNAILNICLNARDAMEGRGCLTIATRNVTSGESGASLPGETADEATGYLEEISSNIIKGDYVLIEISDKGAGIDKAILDRVFEPFFTTKPIGQGTGLGLSQVYGFLKQSGGHIEIESEKGIGTNVRLFLPRARLDSEIAQGEENGQGADPRGHRETLLLVEDDDEVRTYSIEILKNLGYTVLVATRAEEALGYLRQSRAIDLLFTDIGLPGMNGRELAEEACRLRPGLPVLFTSGYARAGIFDEEPLGPGAQLLRKPFTQKELASRLRSLLARRQKDTRGSRVETGKTLM